MTIFKTRVMTCEHCGNTTQHKEKGSHSVSVDIDDFESVNWAMYVCSTCEKASLMRYRTESPHSEFEAQYGDCTTDWTLLYPAGSRLTDLPPEIQRNYQRALKVRNVEPASFAVMIGRTLEAVCKQQGAAGTTLDRKLKNLAEKGRIPGTLAKMAEQVRVLRNLGAHDDDSGDDVSTEDVETIFGFVEAILEYLYVAEIKVAKLEARLQNK